MRLAEVMSKVRFHAAMRRHLRSVVLPEANRSKDATRRSDAMKLMNHHSREGYKLCLKARAMLRGE